METILGLKQEVEGLEKGLADIRRLMEKRRAEQGAAEQAVERAREESKAILAEFRAMQESIQEQDRAVARKTAQLNVLENLQAKFEGFGEGAKSILGGKLGETAGESSVIILSKELKAPAAYTRAVEVLLGSAVDALHVGGLGKSLAIVRKLESERLGRACLQVAPSRRRLQPGVELPEGLSPAAELVQARHEAHKDAVAALLNGCYFAEDLESFLRFWEAHPDFDFLLAATRNGELVDSRGLVYGGRESGQRPAGLLERESEIRSLRTEIEAGRKALNGLREEAAKLDDRRNAAEATVEEQRKRLSALGEEVSGLVAEERNQQQKLDQNARSRQSAEDELAKLDAKHGDSVQALEEARKELAASEEGLQSERKGSSDLEEAIARARELRDQKREALADVRLELAEKKQRLESVDRTLGEVERETASIQNRIIRRNQEIDSVHEQIGEFRRTAESEKARSVEFDRTLGVATDQLDKDRAKLKALDAEITAIDDSLAARRSEAKALDQELNKLEVRLAEERSQLGFIENAAAGDYQVELAEVDWKLQLWEANVEFEKRVNLDDLDDPDKFAAQPKQERRDPTEEELAEMDRTDWDEVEREVGELKARIGNMGPVNLESIGEYADLKERYDFLKGQSEDLWNSKNALVQTIDEINETSQTLFRDTFEQVRKNFAYTYEKLSGGGVSDLELIDSEDPLESGIEIIARPPGTRLKSVTLLSGGQRTMAAVALLFAIYLVKPSPFCVLDEIDAALDDANIGRFCDTLKSFTSKSQFLIVTHNKRTISNADTVFGVTMPEKGVSKLLSMRFNKESNRPELAAVESAKPF